MDQDDRYIHQALKTGMPPEMLAEKFNISREEVIQRGQAVEETAPSLVENGVEDIVDVFTLTCLQYNKVGEGLKMISEHMSDPASLQDIRKVIGSGGGKTGGEIAARLAKNFIILKPFKAPPLGITPEPEE